MAGSTFRLLATALGLGLASPAHALDRLEFRVTGGNPEVERAIRGASALAAIEDQKAAAAQDVFGAARTEYGRLVTALYGLGYYSPVVNVLVDGREAAQIPPLDAPATIRRIEVRVEVGPPFRFGLARVAPLAPKTRLPEGFHTGAPAKSGLVQEAARTAAEGWRAAGHAKVGIARETITADHAARALDADIALAPGPRLRFGPLRVTGEQRMREDRIRKIAAFPTGKPYDPELLQDSADRLRRSGVFRSVVLTEDAGVTPPDLLGVTATLVEEKRRRYSFGAEVSSLEGAAVTAEWLHRNLMGGGERLTVSGAISNIGAADSGTDYTLGVTLERPATPVANTSLALGIKVERLDEEDYLADTAAISATLSRYVNKRISGSLGLGYTYSDVTDDNGAYVYEYVSVPLTVTRDARDDKLNARKGTYLSAAVTPFAGFGDTGSGGQVKLDGRAFTSFGDSGAVVLAGRVQAGAVFGPDLIETPRDFLFYSGGGGTVRGQPYQSLGVRPDASDADYKIGGTQFAGLSAEIRAPLTRSIGLVAFADAGWINADQSVWDRDDWQAGAGLGLRYDTGVGPIRLDVATPVGGDTGDGVQIYVGIGQAF